MRASDDAGDEQQRHRPRARFTDSACTASVVPRSAPSISASAAGSATRPRATKAVTSIAVAVALCSAVAAAAPVAAARSGPAAARAIAPRSAAAEALEDRRLHHVRAPEQQGDAADQVQQDGVAGHRRLILAPPRPSRKGHETTNSG